MEKKRFKKTLIAGTMGLIALAMPFTFVGCDEGKPPIKSDEEAYVMLNRFAKDFKVVNAEKSYENLIEMGQREEYAFDYTHSDLLPETITTLKSMGMESEKESFSRRREYYFNKDNNTGFYVHKTFNYDTLTYDLVDIDVTKKIDNKYINYAHTSDSKDSVEKEKSYVDDEYAKNTYKYENLSKDSSQIYSILECVKEKNTLLDFTNSVSALAGEIISDSADMDINAEDLNVSIDITGEDYDYALTILVSANDLLLQSDEYSTSYGDVDAKVRIVFDENGILGVDSNMAMTLDFTQKSAMYSSLLEIGNTNIDENDVIKMQGFMKQYFVMNFDASLNDRDIIMDGYYDDFSGTGENGSIENRKTNITFNFIDANTAVEQKYSFDENIDLSLNNVSVAHKQGVVVDGLYWDEACTDKILESEKYPSYDTTVYVKIRLAEDWALTHEESYYYAGSSNEYSYSWPYYSTYSIRLENHSHSVQGKVKISNDTLHLTKLIVNDVEVEIILNSYGNVDVPIEEGKIYLIKSYYSEIDG